MGSLGVDCISVVPRWSTVLDFFILNQWQTNSVAVWSHMGSWSSWHHLSGITPVLGPWITHILHLLILGVWPSEGDSRRMAHHPWAYSGRQSERENLVISSISDDSPLLPELGYRCTCEKLRFSWVHSIICSVKVYVCSESGKDL